MRDDHGRRRSGRNRPGAAPSSLLSPLLRGVLGVIGGGSFGTGVCAVFLTTNGTGTGVLLAIGAVLLVFALLGNRIESFEVGGASLRLRAAAAERYQLADASELAGDQDTADALRAEARSLLEFAGPIAAEYGAIRRSMRGGADRTAAMSGVVDDVRRLAAQRDFQPSAVREWLRGGTDGERVVALGMMQTRPELRDFDAVLAAVSRPRSPFEQYLGLVLISKMVDDLGPAELHRLTGTVAAQWDSGMRRGTDRRALADDIIHRASERITAWRTESGSGSGATAGTGAGADGAEAPGTTPGPSDTPRAPHEPHASSASETADARGQGPADDGAGTDAP
ncbi:hypothetical protein [Streptomyces sp. TS71-3]|uniref:hypothetical protein n=1 Tax=Streptomyces sp. TS71-3 TaxID=2733862 RepID=UPI001B2149B7|nr:hypothetical protein [Streptomyces sp. TS71-3]GHJ40043.1 hypothetical protein Sm713_56520 [Streptomyces sp. TS71-3]